MYPGLPAALQGSTCHVTSQQHTPGTKTLYDALARNGGEKVGKRKGKEREKRRKRKRKERKKRGKGG